LRDPLLDKLVEEGWTCGQPLRHHLIHARLIDDKGDRLRRDLDVHALRRHSDRDMPLCWLLLLLCVFWHYGFPFSCCCCSSWYCLSSSAKTSGVGICGAST